MAVNEKQFNPDPDVSGYQKPDILRAKDIIPGNQDIRSSGNQESDIPQFDLARDIMAGHRQMTASRRKSPSSVVSDPAPVSARWTIDEIREASPAEWNPIIADIVTRDIERLCSGRL